MSEEIRNPSRLPVEELAGQTDTQPAAQRTLNFEV